MVQSLLTAIIELIVVAAGRSVLKFLGLEQAAELAVSLFGLACIGLGFAMWWMGYLP
jgi:hypothetical protein